MVVLKELIKSGKVTQVIDRTYPLNEVADALSHYGAGHARGEVIITTKRNEAQERGD
jgi:NADPH:quinone reductase-like Zn-dependent oxidoreductase